MHSSSVHSGTGTPRLLTSDGSTAARGDDLTVDAALSHPVVHGTVPSEALTIALVLLAAIPKSTMVSRGESATHVKVSAAANQLVVGTTAWTTLVLASLFDNKETLVGRL